MGRAGTRSSAMRWSSGERELGLASIAVPLRTGPASSSLHSRSAVHPSGSRSRADHRVRAQARRGRRSPAVDAGSSSIYGADVVTVAVDAAPAHGRTRGRFDERVGRPYCSYQLTLLGAEVIKVETPRPAISPRRLGADEALNRELLVRRPRAKRREEVRHARPQDRRRSLAFASSSESGRPARELSPVAAVSASRGTSFAPSTRSSSTARSPASGRAGRCASGRRTTRSSKGCPG